jgi:hypothetical protein
MFKLLQAGCERFNYILIATTEMIKVIARSTNSPYQDKNMSHSYMFRMLTEGRIHHNFAVHHNCGKWCLLIPVAAQQLILPPICLIFMF